MVPSPQRLARGLEFLMFTASGLKHLASTEGAVCGTFARQLKVFIFEDRRDPSTAYTTSTPPIRVHFLPAARPRRRDRHRARDAGYDANASVHAVPPSSAFNSF
jgi:hypothetical protein